ncbi:uncharacterized protein CCDC198-like isoform X2 [Adelges cooleyi]|uniref:uncharacterized protein CCDC198-like isoform X2 n=1 Tax=Adelges cooleyi TaxID=133065 RepID=UPI00217F2E6D|nr:uncharacterized protein CCDC198-like isoform X2 [Adelges cooleyi]
MGCGGSAMPPMAMEDTANDMKLDIPPAVAFNVPLSEEEESVVKKHPPKRLRMLEEQNSPPLTHEMLLEKLAEADQRRLQILNQRIESAKTLMRPRYNSASKANGGEDKLEENEGVGEES